MKMKISSYKCSTLELQFFSSSCPSYQNFNRFLHFQVDANTSFLRSARAGDLGKLVDFLESGEVTDINASNAVMNYTANLFLSEKPKLISTLIDFSEWSERFTFSCQRWSH